MSALSGGAQEPAFVQWERPLIANSEYPLKVRLMPIGMINKLVHLSQQTYQPNSKLIAGHNDKGYGTIEDEGGREVYFLHDAVLASMASTTSPRPDG